MKTLQCNTLFLLPACDYTHTWHGMLISCGLHHGRRVQCLFVVFFIFIYSAISLQLSVMVPVSPWLAYSEAVGFVIVLFCSLSLSLLSPVCLGRTHYGYFPPLAQAPGLVNYLPLLNLVFLATT